MQGPMGSARYELHSAGIHWGSLESQLQQPTLNMRLHKRLLLMRHRFCTTGADQIISLRRNFGHFVLRVICSLGEQWECPVSVVKPHRVDNPW